MAERLANAGSTYLRQHVGDLVDWWPWGDEALAQARELGRPLLISIGYATCHWCHVMSTESFQDPKIAKFINENFIAVKVDRQERPDVDAAYLQATLQLTGSAGWPMTLFATPDGTPFFAGTYYPPEPRPGTPSFREVLEAIQGAWENRHDEVVESAAAIAVQLDEATDPPEAKLDLWRALDRIAEDFDPINGGFGISPKFPAASLVDALLVKGDPKSLDMAQRSLDAMLRGGIHDQIGGGFHRYAVDAAWVVPHFEKLLVDNALLLGSYLRGWRRTADHDDTLRALLEHTAYGIVGFLDRELKLPSGAFAAGLDADSCDIRGVVHEGIYYLWNQELLVDALGEEEANWASHVFHVTRQGTFEDGLSTLQLRGRPDFAHLEAVGEKLLGEREERFRPATDSLVVAAWNGWLIESLCWGAMLFNEPSWLASATAAATYLWETHWDESRLARTSFEGVAGSHGQADDYGAVAAAFATLSGILGDSTWLRRGEALLDAAMAKFRAEDGGFYDAEPGVFLRTRSFTESASPTGCAALIAALRQVGAMAGRDDLLAAADSAAATMVPALIESPRFCGAALADAFVSDEARRGLGRAVAVVVTDDPFDELARATWRLAPAGTVIIAAKAETSGFAHHLAGRTEGAAYVCRGSVCFEPVTNYEELKDPLWRRA